MLLCSIMQLSAREQLLAESFRWAEPLNAARLNFQPIETNWVVLSGGVSSGKTTLLQELERRGFSVSHEVARNLIEHAYARGLTEAEIFGHTQLRQDSIFSQELERHRLLEPSQRVFLDAGIGDTLGFRSYLNVDSANTSTWGSVYRYSAVFFLEALPLVNDSARPWDANEAASIEREIYDSYLALGYAPILVPAITNVGERADWLIAKLSAK